MAKGLYASRLTRSRWQASASPSLNVRHVRLYAFCTLATRGRPACLAALRRAKARAVGLHDARCSVVGLLVVPVDDAH